MRTALANPVPVFLLARHPGPGSMRVWRGGPVGWMLRRVRLALFDEGGHA